MIFISDVHLRTPDDLNYRRLLAFFDSLPTNLDRLVINGDFFDAWLGNNPAAERQHRPILDRLENLALSGCQITYLEGNHDILLAETLERRGVRFLHGEWRPRLFGRKVLVTHGDRITGDFGYELLYHVFRSPPARWTNAVVPGVVSLRLGEALSGASRSRSRDSEMIVKRKILDYAAGLQEVDILITGHIHVPFDETVSGPNGPVRVINLGDWVTHFTYLWVENDVWELRNA